MLMSALQQIYQQRPLLELLAWLLVQPPQTLIPAPRLEQPFLRIAVQSHQAVSMMTWQNLPGQQKTPARPRGVPGRWTRSLIHPTPTASTPSFTGREAVGRQPCASRTPTQRQLALRTATQRCLYQATVIGWLALACSQQEVQATHITAWLSSKLHM